MVEDKALKEEVKCRIMEMEPDIENMTFSEYLEYKAAKERQLWEDVRSRRRTENMKRMRHDIVQDSNWEQDDDSKED
ncbi:hypothetical protein Tco_1001970 [Tanacetum coccineum]|uniref:Uncharacterized protein n=1 Tax=Tanacetum coccineum TaxID=301880 RepID=A0ABQ5F6T6_9ASTR